MKKLVVITGASSGFGKELAQIFSDAGHPLLLLARRVNLLDEMGLPNTLCRKVDVTDYDLFEAAVREAEAKFGKTDLLINNAGVMLMGSIETQDIEEWRRMVDVNIMGVLNGMKIVIDDMKNQKCGTIINLSSIAGVKPFPNLAAYCATKYGVIGLSEVTRMDLSRYNVRMITILPGAVKTELLGHTTDKKLVEGFSHWMDTVGAAQITARDVAQTIKYAYDMPQGVCLRHIEITDTKQES